MLMHFPLHNHHYITTHSPLCNLHCTITVTPLLPITINHHTSLLHIITITPSHHHITHPMPTQLHLCNHRCTAHHNHHNQYPAHSYSPNCHHHHLPTFTLSHTHNLHHLLILTQPSSPAPLTITVTFSCLHNHHSQPTLHMTTVISCQCAHIYSITPTQPPLHDSHYTTTTTTTTTTINHH